MRSGPHHVSVPKKVLTPLCVVIIILSLWIPEMCWCSDTWKRVKKNPKTLSAFVYLLNGSRHGRAGVNLQPLCANVRARQRLIIHHLLLRHCKSKCVSPWKQPSSLHQGVLGSVSVPSPALDLRSRRSLTPLFNRSDNFINALSWEWFGLVIRPHKSVMWKIAANQSVVLWTTLFTVLLNIVCLAAEL